MSERLSRERPNRRRPALALVVDLSPLVDQPYFQNKTSVANALVREKGGRKVANDILDRPGSPYLLNKDGSRRDFIGNSSPGGFSSLTIGTDPFHKRYACFSRARGAPGDYPLLVTGLAVPHYKIAGS